MKFILTKTSLWDNYLNIESGEPLPSKNIDKKWKISEEIIDGFREGPNKYSGKYKVHMIEINSLEELMKFQQEVGSIIIEEFWLNENYLKIEIYDDYRE